MPLFEIKTNLPASAVPEDYHEQLTDTISAMLGKPKKFVAVLISTDKKISFGGSLEPAALCDLTCIGKIGLEENKGYTATLTEKLNRDLKIPADRMYICFHLTKGENVGWNGKTFAA